MILTLGINSCNSTKSAITQNAFYYWENWFELSQQDTGYLKKLQVNKLYLHFFDVTYTSAPAVESRISFRTKVAQNFEIVPVVFITNETLKNIDSISVIDLAQKLSTRIKRELERTQLTKQTKEVQIDCDWTKSTRDKYFYLLSLIKKQFDYSLSATIRLHQYKYHKNNVPPIDKGMLMCYNVNDPTKFDINNSLFDKKEIMAYLENVNYPLPIDIAMPTFSWGVRFNEKHEFVGLANYMTVQAIKSDTNFIPSQRTNVFVTKRNFSNNWNYFDAGEIIRIEESNPEDVAELIKYLKNKVNQPQATLSFFHYDRLIKEKHEKTELEKLFNVAR